MFPCYSRPSIPKQKEGLLVVHSSTVLSVTRLSLHRCIFSQLILGRALHDYNKNLAPLSKVKSLMSPGGPHGDGAGYCSMKQLRVLLLPLDGMLVHRRVTSNGMSSVPFKIPRWRETLWGKVSCLRTQHDGRDWASNHRPFNNKHNEPSYLLLISMITCP